MANLTSQEKKTSGFGATYVQGCQIFLGTKYQNGGKYAKLLQTIPNVNKI
jgi:hypothetical protein